MSFAQVRRYKRYIMRVPLPSQSSCHLECLSRGNQVLDLRGGSTLPEMLYVYRSQYTCILFPHILYTVSVPGFSLKTTS